MCFYTYVKFPELKKFPLQLSHAKFSDNVVDGTNESTDHAGLGYIGPS